MNGRTDGQNIPCILHNIVPLGPLACSQLENLERKNEKQGMGTANHILTLVDYFRCVPYMRVCPSACQSVRPSVGKLGILKPLKYDRSMKGNVVEPIEDRSVCLFTRLYDMCNINIIISMNPYS